VTFAKNIYQTHPPDCQRSIYHLHSSFFAGNISRLSVRPERLSFQWAQHGNRRYRHLSRLCFVFLEESFSRFFVSRLTSEVVRSEEAKRYRPSPFVARGKDKIPESIFATRAPNSPPNNVFGCAKPSDFVALRTSLRPVIQRFSNYLKQEYRRVITSSPSVFVFRLPFFAHTNRPTDDPRSHTHPKSPRTPIRAELEICDHFRIAGRSPRANLPTSEPS